MKKIFLVYGHYNEKSFNASIKKTFINTAEEKGHEVDLVDLYKEKFDFPFIIAVKGLNRSDVIKSMKNRVKNSYEEEFSTAINQVHKIAKIRLDALEI